MNKKFKVTAFVGSARKKYTYNTTKRFLDNLEAKGNVITELVILSDYNLKMCRGCMQCLNNGEELCPLKDDCKKLITKIISSDGIVLASPNYSLQVSGIMKIFLDRLCYFFHRPHFFGKTFTSIVPQGIYGGDEIVKYFNSVGSFIGFNIVKGTFFNTAEPLSDKNKEKINIIIDNQSQNFYNKLILQELPSPSFFKLMIFRMSRTSIKNLSNKEFKDYKYFTKKGWFESDYYYPVKLNPIKKMVGKFFDFLANKMN